MPEVNIGFVGVVGEGRSDFGVADTLLHRLNMQNDTFLGEEFDPYTSYNPPMFVIKPPKFLYTYLTPYAKTMAPLSYLLAISDKVNRNERVYHFEDYHEVSLDDWAEKAMEDLEDEIHDYFYHTRYTPHFNPGKLELSVKLPYKVEYPWEVKEIQNGTKSKSRKDRARCC